MSGVKNLSSQLRKLKTLPPDTSAEHFRQTLPPNTSAQSAPNHCATLRKHCCATLPRNTSANTSAERFRATLPRNTSAQFPAPLNGLLTPLIYIYIYQVSLLAWLYRTARLTQQANLVAKLAKIKDQQKQIRQRIPAKPKRNTAT